MVIYYINYLVDLHYLERVWLCDQVNRQRKYKIKGAVWTDGKGKELLDRPTEKRDFGAGRVDVSDSESNRTPASKLKLVAWIS